MTTTKNTNNTNTNTLPKAITAPYTRAELNALDDLATARQRDSIPTDADGITERRADHIDALNDIARGYIRRADGTRKYLTKRQRNALKIDADNKRIETARRAFVDSLKEMNSNAVAGALTELINDRNDTAQQHINALRTFTGATRSLWRDAMAYAITADNHDDSATSTALYAVGIIHAIHNTMWHIGKMTEQTGISRNNYFWLIVGALYGLLRNIENIAVYGALDKGKYLKDAPDKYTTDRLATLNDASSKGALDIVHNNIVPLWCAYNDATKENNGAPVLIADIIKRDGVRNAMNRNVSILRDYYSRYILTEHEKMPTRACTYELLEDGTHAPTYSAELRRVLTACKTIGYFDADGNIASQKGAKYTRNNLVKMLLSLDAVAHLNGDDNDSAPKWQRVADDMRNDANGDAVTARGARYLRDNFRDFVVTNKIIKVTEYSADSKRDADSVAVKRAHNKKRAVVVTIKETGKTTKYDSITNCAKGFGVDRATIRRYLNHSNKATIFNGKETFVLTVLDD